MRILVSTWLVLLATGAGAAERPNILWISAEDISAATIGCYGGQAKTPRIDALAKGGLQFHQAFAAAPVCAPSRSAIITGMMPTTIGSLPMRCEATPPPFVVGFPTFLRDAGYYCTNNSKTDYNFDKSFRAGWNESSNKAHWRNRPDKKQPFFAVFNLHVTHESGLFANQLEKRLKPLPAGERADPDVLKVPPFYPNTPIVREALAHRLDLAAVLDRDVGNILDALEADGLADSTIVAFWGDHGEGIPRGKRALTDFGLRVPLIVHVPERFRAAATLPGGGEPAGETKNLVSLMDLGPTMLDMAGVAIPGLMEGRSFLGPHATIRDFVVSVADRMDAAPGFGRSVRDHRFRYVRNFLPWIDGDDLPDYATGVPITGELRKARKGGTLPEEAAWFSRKSRPTEELYDVVADPHEVHDLAGNEARIAEIARLREDLRNWMIDTRDTGVLPEPILRGEARVAGSEWAIFHPDDASHAKSAADRYTRILSWVWAASDGTPFDATDEKPWGWEGIGSDDPAVRFWNVHGIGWQGMCAKDHGRARAVTRLERVLALERVRSANDAFTDGDPVVQIIAAWWLVKLGGGDAQPALDVLGRAIRSDDADIRQQALVAIDQLGEKCRPLWTAAAAIEVGKAQKADEYSRRMIERIRARLDSSPSP